MTDVGRAVILRYLSWLFAPALLLFPLVWIDHTRFFANDSLTYANILSLLSDALKSGEIYPRWFAAANNGLGSPVMMFYVPFAYILTALINLPLSFLHLDIGVQLVIGVYVSQVVSGFTAWLWLSRRFAPQVAWLGSLLFVLLPYKFVYIYLNDNIAQLWALAFLPLWMMAAEDILKNSTRAIAFYAIAFAAVYYTHSLSVIAFGVVPFFYVLWFGRGKGCLLNYSKLVLANLIGIGLCLMQALPQHHYLNWIKPEEFYDRFNWRSNLFHVDVMLCAYYGMIALLIGYAAWKAPALKKISNQVLFWAVVIAIVAFMTQPASSFLWEHIPLLAYLQFPAARLHAPALIAVIYLICVWLTYWQEILPLAPLGYKKQTLALLIAVFAGATFLHLQAIYAHSEDTLADRTKFIQGIRESNIISAPEYETHWGCGGAAKEWVNYQQHLVRELITKDSDKAKVAVKVWNPPQQIVVTAQDAAEGAIVSLRQCYIPKWEARDESGRPVSVFPDKTAGLLNIALPSGSHTITIQMAETSIEYYSRLVSCVSLLVCGLLLIRRPKHQLSAI